MRFPLRTAFNPAAAAAAVQNGPRAVLSATIGRRRTLSDIRRGGQWSESAFATIRDERPSIVVDAAALKGKRGRVVDRWARNGIGHN